MRTCPFCKRQFDSERADAMRRCPHCRKELPRADEPATVNFQQRQPTRRPVKKVRPRPEAKRRFNTPLILVFALLTVVAAAFFVGYPWLNSWLNPPPPANSGGSSDFGRGPFKDNVKANVQDGQSVLEISLTDRMGAAHRVSDHRDKNHVMLVFMRGLTKNPGGVCPLCSTQTSRLIKNHAEFHKRNTAVLVVYPGAAASVDQFVAALNEEKLPFPVLLDENLQAVDRLGLRDDLAKPATYIIDKQGQMRFGYVGATTVDRPSLSFLLKQLDELNH